MNREKQEAILNKTQPAVRMEMQTFSEYLQKEGLKITNQRMLVAERIFSLHNHFTAEGLLEEFKDQRDQISKATIYRILSIMVSAGLLQEHNFGKDYKYYEHIIGHKHHDHIICTVCGKIVEFLDERIEQLQEQAARENGFKITGHSLNIYGTCNEHSSSK
ncbi:Fur family transcriptional regulator [Leptospira interrogans]|uniref:Ferric uptake regulation protein n=18 Tax=Leptospira interrogans TaxID=173 RepID=Q8F1N7_LEPIN|nr:MULTISPECIES: Fur family transcriptional regulator [Leptospira]APH40937.1 Transcriptional repressor [Leptospira interrogans serovar Copenhageni/Icterohaemorrhagiae]EMF42281.1 ferric uptake regulator family protein [Leptospira interrogans serovar Lora str. TE 1992]EMF70551.1 ferric uptake regulator family protein [Leptospira interrogans serovar Canicola str. LT1962]EMG09378.1 ferric uptake regulator family protein [Leptospira interrogans serovar Grippotyphosa str. LT2186]EMM79522.1 ferric up